MTLSRAVLGGLFALGIIGLSADSAQAQYFRSGGYHGIYRDYIPIPTILPQTLYGYPIYGNGFGSAYYAPQPYYGPRYYQGVAPSYFNFNYNSAYGANPYSGSAGYNYGFRFGNYYR